MIVLWSGGADSTLALYQLLSNSDHRVRALTIEVTGVPMRDEQRWAREEQKRVFAAMGYAFEHRTIVIDYPNTAESIKPVKMDGHSIQGQWWLANAVEFLRPAEGLCLSYIKGEFDYFETTTQAAFDALQRMGGKTGKLYLPFRGWRKYRIVSKLRTLGLWDVTWSCEGGDALSSQPFLEECGECKKCIEIARAQWELDTYGFEALSIT